jgi:hypothetical protein
MLHNRLAGLFLRGNLYADNPELHSVSISLDLGLVNANQLYLELTRATRPFY